jgi:aldehyde:ferredoxin oxidoreductase
LPTRNFRQGVFEEAEKINWNAYEKELLIARSSCYACAIRCKRDIAIGGPEYEGVGSFGSNCAVYDLQAIARANELCNAYGLDCISAGMTISFAMECFEKGLIGLEDTDGIELRFGNTEAMLTMIEKIARREGFGNLLAEGSKRAAETIGRGMPYDLQFRSRDRNLPCTNREENITLGLAMPFQKLAPSIWLWHTTQLLPTLSRISSKVQYLWELPSPSLCVP